MALVAGAPVHGVSGYANGTHIRGPRKEPVGAKGRQGGGRPRPTPISRVSTVWGPSSSKYPTHRPALGCQREGTYRSCTPRPRSGSGGCMFPRGSPLPSSGSGAARHRALQTRPWTSGRAVPAVGFGFQPSFFVTSHRVALLKPQDIPALPAP